ncbi:MAG: LicD family protein, partial [Gordonibacter sp.]|uniref:LicD family protein n=1 Tax=Gordonibacter sp. TaxID=1968902 RepID=UPI002FC6CB53
MQALDLDKVKRVELELLTTFHEYCEENGLNYFMCYGTLLGAVRHQGFIPWDDDIDVAMPRNDYEKLYASFPADHQDSHIKLVSYRDKTSIYPFFKLIDTRTEVREDFVDPQYISGVWIDIFPIDGIPANNRPFKANRRAKRKYNFTVGDTSKGTTPFRALVKRVLTPLLAAPDIYLEAARLDELAATIPPDPNGDVGVIVWGEGERERMPYASLNTTKLPFEGREFYALANYEDYLTRIYGDYLELPPAEDRKPHAMHAIWVAEELYE